MLGGGRFPLGASTGVPDEKNCLRADRRNLTDEWLLKKWSQGYSAKYVENNQQLLDTDTTRTENLIGDYWCLLSMPDS